MKFILIFINIIIFQYCISQNIVFNQQIGEMEYCSDSILLGTLLINKPCGEDSLITYDYNLIKQKFNIPLINDVKKIASEDTEGNLPCWEFTFKDERGEIFIEIINNVLPQFSLTHPDIPLRIGDDIINIGTSLTSLKNSLSRKGYLIEEENLIYIYVNYSVISFEIKNELIESIGFYGNYFY